MATITVQEQLDILSESKTIPTCLHADGMFSAIIFATPKIDMNPTVIDIKGRQWNILMVLTTTSFLLGVLVLYSLLIGINKPKTHLTQDNFFY